MFRKTIIIASLLAGSTVLAQDPYLRPSLDARDAMTNVHSVIPQVNVAMTNANVVNVRNGEILRDVTVTVKDGMIVSVSNDAPPEVLAQAFGASSIDFTVIWWADPTPIDEMRSKDEVVEAIKGALDDAGIEIPYPYRTLTFSQNEPAIIDAVAGRLGGSGATGGESSVQGPS